VMTVPVTTGRDGFNTPRGVHRVQWKAALRTMKGTSNGETWEVPNVPHAMYLTSTGVALHGAYWHRLFGSGTRLSHGCINLPLDVAALLYDWASVGTQVEVRD
jgi:lipoprotein-anchoring transpeptidase ErfK/SrfK